MKFSICLLLFAVLCIPLAAQDGAAIDHLAAFSDPARIWEDKVERAIEEAYRACFKTRIIGDRIMIIRMPFAENHERDMLSDTAWKFVGDGKAGPAALWPEIEKVIASEAFAEYVAVISDGKEQVIIFDIPKQTWSSSREHFDIARMKAGSYRGLPHRPYVLVSGRGIEETDVYNYLYCIGLIGMDCSGFVWHVLSYVANKGGFDLGRAVSRSLGVSWGRDPAQYVGTAFFNSSSSHLSPVSDELANLCPADIILFRGSDGTMAHSAIIQSVDFTKGIIRYLQCTDEAPLYERGVHESFIYFDPGQPNLSLSDPSLNWIQKRYAPFPGEKDSAFSDDGERYRAYSELGGGRVVRVRTLAPVLERIRNSR